MKRIVKYCLAVLLLLTAVGAVMAVERAPRAGKRAVAADEQTFTVVIAGRTRDASANSPTRRR